MEPHVSLSNLKFFKSANQNAAVYYNKLCCTIPSPLKSQKEMNNSLGCFLISKINNLVPFILIDIAEGGCCFGIQMFLSLYQSKYSAVFVSRIFAVWFWFLKLSRILRFVTLVCCHVASSTHLFLSIKQTWACSMHLWEISENICGRKQCHIFRSWLSSPRFILELKASCNAGENFHCWTFLSSCTAYSSFLINS